MKKSGIGILVGVSLLLTHVGQVAYAQTVENASAQEALKKQIGTKEQAINKLDEMFPSLWHSYHIWQGRESQIAILRSGKQILESEAGSEAGRSDMATAVAYLLSDDYQSGVVYGFAFAQDGSLDPIKAATYIYKEGKYHLFDPVVGMKGDLGSRHQAYFENKSFTSLEEMGEYIRQTPAFNRDMAQVYAVPKGEAVKFVVDPNTLTVQVEHPQAKLLYSNTKLADERFKHIKPENIHQYKLPKILGGLTLSIEEAKVLVGKSPQVIKEKVRTAGDLLLYMLASRTLLENGDQTIWAEGEEWHYNKTTQEVLSSKRGNCGSMANLANYLLEGDYEEIGFVLHSYYSGQGGGHVYNYIKHQGEYTIVDFSDYLFSNYSVTNEFNFIKMKSLKDYGTRWKECYGSLAAIVVHQSAGTHLPNVWSGNHYYLPEGAAFEVLLETPQNGYKVETLPLPQVVPDWSKPQVIKEIEMKPIQN